MARSRHDYDAALEEDLWEYVRQCHSDPTIVNEAKLFGVDIVRYYRDHGCDWFAVANVFKQSPEKVFRALADYTVAGETIRREPLWKQLFDPDRKPDGSAIRLFIADWEMTALFSLHPRRGRVSLTRARRLLMRLGLADSKAEATYLLDRLVSLGVFEYQYITLTRRAQMVRIVENGKVYYRLVTSSPGTNPASP